MLVQTVPDTLTKLTQLGDVTTFEPAGDQPQQERQRGMYQSHSLAECITNVSTPKGKKAVLKASPYILLNGRKPFSQLSLF